MFAATNPKCMVSGLGTLGSHHVIRYQLITTALSYGGVSLLISEHAECLYGLLFNCLALLPRLLLIK